MLPDLYAVFFAGGADPRPREESRTQSEGETPLIHERGLPTIPRKPLSRFERACYHEKVVRTTVAAAHTMLNLSRTYRRSPTQGLSGPQGKKKIEL